MESVFGKIAPRINRQDLHPKSGPLGSGPFGIQIGIQPRGAQKPQDTTRLDPSKKVQEWESWRGNHAQHGKPASARSRRVAIDKDFTGRNRPKPLQCSFMAATDPFPCRVSHHDSCLQ